MENTILNAAVNYVLENSSYKDIFDLCIKTEGRKLKDAAHLELLNNFVSTRGLDGSPKHVITQTRQSFLGAPPASQNVVVPTFSAAAIKRAPLTMKYVKLLEGSFTNDIAAYTDCCWTSAKSTLDYLVHKGDVYRVGSKYYAVDHP